MAGHQHPKTSYTDPTSGSAVAVLRDKLVSPRGITAQEAVGMGIVKDKSVFGTRIAYLRDMCGYDVRVFPVTPDRKHRRTTEVIYKAIARYNWDTTVAEDFGAYAAD